MPLKQLVTLLVIGSVVGLAPASRAETGNGSLAIRVQESDLTPLVVDVAVGEEVRIQLDYDDNDAFTAPTQWHVNFGDDTSAARSTAFEGCSSPYRWAIVEATDKLPANPAPFDSQFVASFRKTYTAPGTYLVTGTVFAARDDCVAFEYEPDRATATIFIEVAPASGKASAMMRAWENAIRTM